MNNCNTKKRASDTATVAPAIAWRAMYHLLLSKAWLVTSCVVVAAFAGAAYLQRAPKVYQAHTVLQVEQSEQKVLNIQEVSQEDLRTAELLKTIEQNLTSSDLLLRVIRNVGLATDTRFLAARAGKPYSDDELLAMVLDDVTAKLRRGTRLIDITVRHTHPEVAQLLAQSLVKEYLRQGFEQRLGTSQMANEFLIEEASRLKTKLEGSERALQAYREQHQAVSLDDTQNITVEALKELSSSYNEAKGARMRLESEFAQTHRLRNSAPAEWLTLTSVANAPEVVLGKQAVAEKEVEIATLSNRYRAEHPKFIQAQSQLRELQLGYEQRIRKAADAVKTHYEGAIVTETKFREALEAQQQQALNLNRLAIPYNSLVRDVESDRAMYQAVLTRLKETDVAKGVETSNVRIVQSARLPKAPISPVPIMVMIGAVFGGLVLGLALVFGMNALDTSIRTVDDAEEYLGLNAYGAIPNNRKLRSAKSPLVLVHEPESAISEAFRSLRTALTIKATEGTRIVLMTSAVPGEGKSFSSANTAVAFAQQGFNTLLIDADLRRPTVSKVFHPGEHPAGLTEHLQTGTPLNDLLRATQVANLTLLPAGAVAPNPAELFKSANLAQLFANPLLEQFERIVIDSAPVNAVSDTLHLVTFAHAVCLVVRAGSTPRRALLRAYHELVEASGRCIGLIVNRLPAQSGAGYYYYYSAGAYGAEGVYGAKVPANT